MSKIDIYYYGDHDRRYPGVSFGLLNRFLFQLKRWGRTSRLNCPVCGVFMDSPVWNEDLHRFEWYCLGDRLGCLEAVGDYPLVLHSGFEVVEELSDEDKKRLYAMIEEVQLPYPREILRRLRGVS